MNTTETIILTTIINVIITGLVGGIIIYAIQKKIDAATQKSLFEHQVKFSRAYPKTLEVLDALYQKFMTFTDAVKGWVDHVEAFFIMEGSTGAGEFRGYYSDVQEKFEECEKYFAANPLVLV